LSLLEAAAIVTAAVAAGVANAIVGSGTLITFPTLIHSGMRRCSRTSRTRPASSSGHREHCGVAAELEGQRSRSLLLGTASVTGAVLLFELPASAFRAIVPAFIGIGVALVAVQPPVSRYLARKSHPQAAPGNGHGWAAAAGLFVVGVYGGYFGAG